MTAEYYIKHKEFKVLERRRKRSKQHYQNNKHYYSVKTAKQRALKRKNLPLEQIQNRMSLQISEKTKKLKADFTINNNGNMDQLHKKLEQYYHSLSI